ncbi:GNAT family N-acetyltransferase [Streptomyces sp. NPDC086010]|uniref:GNAT family N-acetyltransferase n=1 Tax=Streptomyces sp. NPDC086010 TaxID=3365745 RepID=UPI0037D4DC00
MSPYTEGPDGVRAVGGAAALEAAGWDSLLGAEDFFQTPRWLTVQEVNSGTAMDFLVRERDGAPVAGLVTAWADSSVAWLLARPDAMLKRALEQDVPEAAAVLRAVAGGDPDSLLPSLVCGGRHLGRTRTLASADATGDDLAALVGRAEAMAPDRGAATVCFPHVDVRDTSLVALLESRGYHHHPSDHYAWLDIPPGGFEQFVEEMSAHRRRRVRLERRALAEAGVEVNVEPLTQELCPRLGQLDANLLRKYGNPASDEGSARMIGRIAEIMGDDVLVSVARQRGAVIGFGMVLRSRARGEEQWYGHRAGFDYEAQGKLPLYYDVLYYEVLDAAAKEGATVLHAGIGSVKAKLARGCRVSEQRSYLLPLRRKEGAAGTHAEDRERTTG